jgi:hypothetical protein
MKDTDEQSNPSIGYRDGLFSLLGAMKSGRSRVASKRAGATVWEIATRDYDKRTFAVIADDWVSAIDAPGVPRLRDRCPSMGECFDITARLLCRGYFEVVCSYR